MSHEKTPRIGFLDRLFGVRFDKEKLAKVDLVVVHGGSEENGVAAGMFFMGLVKEAKGSLPPILFTGKWYHGISDEEKPRNKKGEITTEANSMKEWAIDCGLDESLTITEEASQTVEDNVVKSLQKLQEKGIDPKTVLVVSSHPSPIRALLNWRHYAPGIDFIAVGDISMEMELKNMNGQANKYNLKEAAKIVYTVATLPFKPTHP